MGNPATDAARAIAAEGWVYGYPLLENYRTMYPEAVDADDPRSVGGFGRFRHGSEPAAPAGADGVPPDGDAPYSRAWLDLRAEPWVVSVPAVDRYYVLPVHDLDTSYVGFVGTRTTGSQPGDHLIAGPGWTGEPPEGLAGVLRADSDLAGIIARTHLVGPDDAPTLRAIQEQYQLRPLSTFLGAPAPEPAPEPVWPVWREDALDSAEFFRYLDFLLGFFPVLPAEAALRERLDDLGVDGSGGFEPGDLIPEVREAIEQGIADARDRLDRASAEATDSSGWFGTRVQQGDDYLTRAVGVYNGPYALPVEEARYEAGAAASEGTRRSGARG
ncbi:DUF1254 domain-containing protein [Streptomyces sp. H27-D2]|uniref:DUF1254 domain-containing protein n=1 Tax=Streptomyces sp. H27-D2 TaxID=3046304 RepID=UPI002DB8A294|nr:DUF1254 domain-containing protein [Streptomyces sp. H27-D2]MEC4018226.1 DUF1254 domain-containing protein [Streptomyces sp. H27-D2]